MSLHLSLNGWFNDLGYIYKSLCKHKRCFKHSYFIFFMHFLFQMNSKSSALSPAHFSYTFQWKIITSLFRTIFLINVWIYVMSHPEASFTRNIMIRDYEPCTFSFIHSTEQVRPPLWKSHDRQNAEFPEDHEKMKSSLLTDEVTLNVQSCYLDWTYVINLKTIYKLWKDFF